MAASACWPRSSSAWRATGRSRLIALAMIAAATSLGSISTAKCWSGTMMKAAPASLCGCPPTTGSGSNRAAQPSKARPVTMPSIDVNAVAALIAEVAAEEIQPRFRNLATHEQREKAPGDIVTIADERAEAALTPRLIDLVPGSIVIGEEAAAKDPELVRRLSKDQVAWIVDPVDGTANFAEGKAVFCSMVALVRGDELIASWIHLPTTGQTAIAERGAGATFDGARIPILARTSDALAGVVGVGKF